MYGQHNASFPKFTGINLLPLPRRFNLKIPERGRVVIKDAIRPKNNNH